MQKLCQCWIVGHALVMAMALAASAAEGIKNSDCLECPAAGLSPNRSPGDSAGELPSSTSRIP